MNNITEEKIKAVEKILEEEKSKSYKKGVLFGAIAMAVMFFVMTIIGWYPPNGGKDTKLNALEYIVNKYYLFEDKVDKDIKKEATYKGYIASLGDPYSVYMTKDEFKEFSKELDGKFYGVGIVYTIDDSADGKVPRVINVLENSAAEKEDIKSNDLILEIDGKSLKNMNSGDIAQLLKGEKNSQVTLTIKRESIEKIFKVKMTRKEIKSQTVLERVLDDGTGYILVKEFDTKTAKDFKTAIDNLLSKNVNGLIIDLRNNTGGLMDVTTDMLDYLLPKGKLVTTKYKDGSKDTVRAKTEHEVNLPMAILINGTSASASEMFTGAMQDYNRAVVIGTRSFGKGIVQNIYNLKDGSGVKLTVAEYLTPKNRRIHKKGIIPDIVVEDTRESIVDKNDAQLRRAKESILEQIEENRSK